MKILLIGLGGAIGSVARYLTTYFIVNKVTFSPVLLGTFTVNFLGCLLIGIFIGLSNRYDWLPEIRLFLITGICGGYTTFSAFTHENLYLMQQGNYSTAFLYILGSIVICLGATFLGLWIARIF